MSSLPSAALHLALSLGTQIGHTIGLHACATCSPLEARLGLLTGGGCCLWGCNAGISLQGRPPCAAEPELDNPVRGVNQKVFCGSRGEQPLEPCHRMFAMELMPGSRIVTSQGP